MFEYECEFVAGPANTLMIERKTLAATILTGMNRTLALRAQRGWRLASMVAVGDGWLLVVWEREKKGAARIRQTRDVGPEGE